MCCRKHFLFDSYPTWTSWQDTWRRGNRCRGTGHRSDDSRDALSVAGVTILLSQTVFSLLVAHVITQTSDAVPLIG